MGLATGIGLWFLAAWLSESKVPNYHVINEVKSILYTVTQAACAQD
jgi:hypothetical protein